MGDDVSPESPTTTTTTSSPKSPPLNYASPPPRGSALAGRDELAYVLPMGLFLALVWFGGTWPALYPAAYVLRTIAVAALLVALRRHYTPVRWNAWGLGLIVGVAGIVQWVGMQLWLQRAFPSWFAPSPDPFDPTTAFDSPAVVWAFVAVRVIGAVLVVPVMEELFWRDYLWRQLLAPNDFKLAAVGEWGWLPFLGVSAAFAVVHGNWWLTSIVWGLMVAGLLVYTKSLGACIVAHATTNLLLAAYVLWTRDWSFW
jgi:CAAX prenyl protease-like protein